MSDPPIHADDGSDLHADDVSRAYRASAREEPSPALDEAISAAARRGGGTWPRAIVRSFPQRWKFPLAIAATLVIGVSIAFLALERPGAPKSLNANAPVGVAGEKAASTAAPGGLQQREGLTPRSDVVADVGRTGPERQMPPPGLAARETRPSRERTTRDEMIARRAQQADIPVQAPAPSPAASPPLPASAAGNGLGSTALQAAPPAPAAPGSAENQPLRKASPRAEMQVDHEAELLSPEVWLQRIRELRAKGDLVQADASLRAFRRRHPDYPLPADIPAPTDRGP